MCGIFSYVGTRHDAGSIVFEGLRRLEYRGYDSWGIAIADNTKIEVLKRVGKIDKDPKLPSASIAIGHDRWATHGGVTEENAHPHLDCSGKIAVVHNGIIENYQELKDALKGEHKFKSETDTEVFAHLVEENFKGDIEEAITKSFKKLKGRNAFVVMSSDGSRVVGVRDGSPLVLGVGTNEYYLASDVPAFLEYTKEVVFLEDREGVVIDKDGFKLFHIDGEKVTSKQEKITWDIEQAEKGKYSHFLLKEIMEQPVSMVASVAQNKEEIEILANTILKAFGSYLVACGTASYATLYGTYMFSTIAKKHINHLIGSEFSSFRHFLTKKSLIIAVSQSGETADTLEVVEIAKKKGAKTVAIVNVMGSTLARIADHTILTNAGPEIAVLSTKAFTSQLSLLLMLAYAAVGKFEYGRELVERTAKEIAKVMDDDSQDMIKKIAEKIKKSKDIYIIGKGQNYPIALEAALKIKEASYIHGEGFAAGELKHGVITLIEKGTPCIVLFANDSQKAYTLGSAMEMKARGGYMIGIGPENNDVFDEFIRVADIPEASALLNTPPIQLLAYYLAVLRGNNPDRPRNLAKSVTVK